MNQKVSAVGCCLVVHLAGNHADIRRTRPLWGSDGHRRWSERGRVAHSSMFFPAGSTSLESAVRSNGPTWPYARRPRYEVVPRGGASGLARSMGSERQTSSTNQSGSRIHFGSIGRGRHAYSRIQVAEKPALDAWQLYGCHLHGLMGACRRGRDRQEGARGTTLRESQQVWKDLSLPLIHELLFPRSNQPPPLVP